MNAKVNTNTPPQQPIKLYGMALSGHCHRVHLFLSLLGLPFEQVNVDLMGGAHKRPEFLAMNPFGQVPVIEDGDVTLADSNAILVYLEGRYAPGQWLPRDPVGAACVQRWLPARVRPRSRARHPAFQAAGRSGTSHRARQRSLHGDGRRTGTTPVPCRQ